MLFNVWLHWFYIVAARYFWITEGGKEGLNWLSETWMTSFRRITSDILSKRKLRLRRCFAESLIGEDYSLTTWLLEINGWITLHGLAQWIQYKLGKQYLWNKLTPPWESNPAPSPNRGVIATPYSVCWFKKTCGHSPLYPSRVGFPWLSIIR